MDTSNREFDVDGLLANAGWMRGLARGIVGEAAADDVVQEAWIVALDRRPDRPGGSHLRAWLGRVVGNLARNRRRRESLRLQVEARAARNEAIENESSAHERLQLQRALAEALLEVREPNRSAVIMRYLDGCSAETIAARSGCTPEAARQRVSRGLAELRQRFAAREKRGGWERLTALVGPTQTLAAGWGADVGSKAGAVAMGKMAGWIGLATAGAVLGWLALRGQRQAAKPAAALAAQGPIDSGELTFEIDSAAATSHQAGVGASAHRRVEIAVAASTSVIVTSTAGAAIFDASVRPRGSPTHWGSTDAQGVFELELPGSAPGPIAASVSHPMFVTTEFELALDTRTEVQMAAKPVVRFELRLPGGDVPLELEASSSAELWVRDETTQENERFLAEVEQGCLVARGISPGRLTRARARIRGFASGSTALDVLLHPDQVTTVRIDLESGLRLFGMVNDAESGLPIAGAKVWAEGLWHGDEDDRLAAITDERGAFALTGVEGQVLDASGRKAVMVSASAAGYESRLPTWHVVEPGSNTLVQIPLALADARLNGRVLGIEGLRGPLQISVAHEEGLPRFAAVESDGSFVVDALRPGRYIVVVSNVNTFATRDPQFSDPRARASGEIVLAAGEHGHLELALQLGSVRVSGRVVDMKGNGVADQRIMANMLERMGALVWGSFAYDTRSNESGDFVFEALLPGSYDLALCDLPHGLCAVDRVWSVDLEPDASRSDARLRVSDCMVVDGWVELGQLDPARLTIDARLEDGTELAVESPVAADGSFQFPRLPGVGLHLVLTHPGGELLRQSVRPPGARGLVLRPEKQPNGAEGGSPR